MWDSCQIAELCLRCWGVGLWKRCTEELKAHKAASAAVQPDCAGSYPGHSSTLGDATGPVCPCAQPLALEIWGWLCFLLWFLLQILLLPSPPLSLLRCLKIIFTIIFISLLWGESMCVHMCPCGEQRTASGSFFSVGSRIELRFSGSQGKHSPT